MTTSAEWTALAARIEAATGPDIEIDDGIYWLSSTQSHCQFFREHKGARQRNVSYGLGDHVEPDWRPLGPYDGAPGLTRSIDAITSLIERDLPGCVISSRSMSPFPGELCSASLSGLGYDFPGCQPLFVVAATEALARCLAYARAKAAIAAQAETAGKDAK